MKKTVLALAAVAASSAALAQSSVSLYGVVDASVESVKGSDTVTRVSSDNLASSRVGLKGTEDLGGGLKAKFVLETSLKTDTGASNAARFWDRAAWVGLAGGAGELRLGRIDSTVATIGLAALGLQPYDELVVAGTYAGSGTAFRRLDNAITYVLPTLVPGLTAQLQYSTARDSTVANNAEVNGDSSLGKTYGLSANYVNGPFAAGLGYNTAKTDFAGDNKQSALLVYGAYDFKAVKLTAYYNVDKNDAAAEDRKVWGVRAGVPLAERTSLQLGYADVSNVGLADNADAKIFLLGLQHDLSKRTAVYARLTQVNNDGAARLVVSGAPALTSDDTSRGIAFGIRHQF